MLLSMTGFGDATVHAPERKITVEIKSLNSKQFDMSARVPAIYRDKELEIRNRLASRLMRGKVDMVITAESSRGTEAPRLNLDVMRDYKEQITNASRELDLPLPTDWYSVLVRMPDIYECTDAASSKVSEVEAQALADAVDEAADALIEFRMQEGARLEEFFTKRIEAIAALLEMVPQYESERVAKIRARIEDGLGQLHMGDYDRSRLEQEMIFYIEKLDINEEKQRLSQHLSYFKATMNAEPGQGKKLGFIAQEMGREINTLGSKSNHADMQKLVVKMKDELEQIKEQVLNVL